MHESLPNKGMTEMFAITM